MNAQTLTTTLTALTIRRASRRPWRLLAATMVVAIAGSLGQAAMAMPGRGAGPGMEMMSPRFLDRALDTVNATAEQRAQIKQIVQAAHTDLKAQRDAGRSLRDQSQALFTQPNIDARAAETLRAQMSAQHDQASKRILQAMLDVSRVLTPEQRKTLADKMAQRRAMMERHRAERDATATR